MTEYGLNLYWRNLLTRLSVYEQRGVQFCLDDEGELTIRIPPKALREQGARETLKQSKLELLRAVRLREGLCVICGMDRAKHPSRKGTAQNFDWQTLTTTEGDCSSLLVYPMYCQSCWESRAMWRGIVEKKQNARREEAEEKDSGDDPDTPVRRGRQTPPDDDGDSRGQSVAVLSFTAD